jgi:hypothetical protein
MRAILSKLRRLSCTSGYVAIYAELDLGLLCKPRVLPCVLIYPAIDVIPQALDGLRPNVSSHSFFNRFLLVSVHWLAPRFPTNTVEQRPS